LKSVAAERLLGKRLAVLALRDPLPRAPPPAALLEGRVPPGGTLLRSCTTARMPHPAAKKATAAGMWSGIIMHNAKKMN